MTNEIQAAIAAHFENVSRLNFGKNIVLYRHTTLKGENVWFLSWLGPAGGWVYNPSDGFLYNSAQADKIGRNSFQSDDFLELLRIAKLLEVEANEHERPVDSMSNWHSQFLNPESIEWMKNYRKNDLGLD